jgi:excinuclease ABC subunit C
LLRRDCGRVPGVYGMLNQREELVYVGKAKCLRTRLLSYFRRRSRDPKAGRILAYTRAIIWEPAPNEFAALLRELELIHLWQPRFNVRGQPARRRLTYVCLSRPPARYLYLSRTPPSAPSYCYGPVREGWRAREAIRHLNDYFKLRDCPKKQRIFFANEKELFPTVRTAGCLRYEIGTCLAPCIGACEKEDYRLQTHAARGFLEGRNNTLLTSLEENMNSASGRMDFEKAARLRDKLAHLKWLNERLGKLRAARAAPPYIYAADGPGGVEIWYLIRNGSLITALSPPKSVAEKRAMTKTLECALAGRNSTSSRRQPLDMDLVYLIAAWFRRYTGEKRRVLSLYGALALCR